MRYLIGAGRDWTEMNYNQQFDQHCLDILLGRDGITGDIARSSGWSCGFASGHGGAFWYTTWCGMTGEQLENYCAHASPEVQAEILCAVYHTGYYQGVYQRNQERAQNYNSSDGRGSLALNFSNKVWYDGDGDGKAGVSNKKSTLDKVAIGFGLGDYTREGIGFVSKQDATLRYISKMTGTTVEETSWSMNLLNPAFKGAGKLLFWGGATISFGQGLNNYFNGNYLGATKNGFDLGLAFWGLAGPAALVGGVLYFAVDAFYPYYGGGWNGAMYLNSYLQSQTQNVVPGFNLYRDF